jgi:uncharacterized protein (DUF2147 family)
LYSKKEEAMKRLIFIALSLVATLYVHAGIQQIIGEWKTVDDKTGDNFYIVSIYRGTDGLYYGKIAKMLVGPQDLRCDQCTGADHNAPIEGLVIIRGMSYDAENNLLKGGKVLDPESGKFYYGKIYPKNGKLVLRGSIDKRGFLGRNQTWIRK